MRDYVKEMMNAWTTEGDQAAYDLGSELLKQIGAQYDFLKNQASAITALGNYLQDTANVEARDPNPDPNLDTVEMSERPRLIVEAALSVWRRLPPRNDLVKVQHVLRELNDQGLDLGVKQPFAVIGTVLASAEGFTKVARNTFEYNDPAEDLPF